VPNILYTFCLEPGSKPRLQYNLRDSEAQNVGDEIVEELAVSVRCANRFQGLRKSATHHLGPDGTQVQCIDLIEIFRATEISQFYFSKIDIEGGEVELPASAADDELRWLGRSSIESRDSAKACRWCR